VRVAWSDRPVKIEVSRSLPDHPAQGLTCG